MRVWQKNRGHTHARTHACMHAMLKARPCYLFMPQLRMPAGVKTLSLGVFFFLCLTVKPWVCTHPCCKTGRGIFRDELLAQAQKKNLYCFELIWKRELIFGRQGGGGEDGQLSNLGSAICNKEALCFLRFSFEEQFWWFFHPPRDRVTEGKREALRGLGYTLETNWCFLSTGHSSLLPVWWEMKRREGMRTFMWFADICVGLCLTGEPHYNNVEPCVFQLPLGELLLIRKQNYYTVQARFWW